jgi:thymidine phosphorylase
MDQPLGAAVGNSLEVREAIEVLRGEHKGSDLYNVCLALGACMLLMAKAADNETSAEKLLADLISSGRALQKFEQFVTAQGGDGNVVRELSLLPQARCTETVAACQSGYVQEICTADIGLCATLMGAGREYKGQQIDLAAGLIMKCRIGDKVEAGQPLAELFASSPNKFAEASLRLSKAIIIGSEPIPAKPLIYGIVDEAGFSAFL